LAPGGSQRYPEPTVGALVLNDRGEMLLVKSPKWGDRFTVAGGHVEVGETLEAALKREIREEVGLEIEDLRLLMVQQAIFSKDFFRPRHFIFFDFVCSATSDRPKVDGVEIQSCEWVTPKRALGLRLEKFTRRMVRKFLSEEGPTGPGESLRPGASLRRGIAPRRRAPPPRPAERRRER
jgi:nucleoside triphosphatase